jgi:alpha-beta hydrolase superfamily lysophospholipase
VTEQLQRPAVAPSVVVHAASGPTTAVVLVLPGGRADSFAPTDTRQLTAVRMRPFARSLHRAGRTHGIAVWMLRYRYRGWNGTEMSPVPDAVWALDEVRRRHGDLPVVLVGHSMGGRTSLRVAGDERVRAVVALAPWLFDTEPVEQLAGRDVLIAHGDRDRVTSPRASRRYADRAAAAGARVGYVVVRGDMHGMLFRWRTWHRLATGFTLAALGGQNFGGRGKNPDVRST